MVIASYQVLMVVKALGYRKVGLVEKEARPPSE